MVPRTLVFAGCLSLHVWTAHFVPVSFTCCHAPWSAPAAKWSRRLCVVPGTRMLPLIHGAEFMYAAAHQCCRASLWPRVCGSAHSYTAAHMCCRDLVMLPRIRVAAHPWFRAPVCCRAPMFPRTVACG